MSHEHRHDEDDPFLSESGAEVWSKWSPVLETGTRQVSEALLDAAGVRAGSRVLDLACGLGPTSASAAQRGAVVTGLDLNEHMLARAFMDDAITYVHGDMRSPPAGPWDAIVSRFGAHHADPAWVQAAQEQLAPGGVLAIAEWHPETALFDLEADEPFAVEDEADDWVARFEATGLRDVQASEVAFIIDFGDDAAFDAFLQDMADGARSRARPEGGKQRNRAFIVTGRR